MTPHVLIIRFSAIGDVAMAVPVVYSAAKQYPCVRFTVLSRPFARPFFEHLAPNVFFMSADVKWEYHGLRGLNALYRRLAAKNFTAIADFHDVLRTKYLRVRFSLDITNRIPVAHINKHRAEKRRLCDKRNNEKHQLPTSFDNYCDVLAKLGYPVKLNFNSIFGDSNGSMRKFYTPKIGAIAPDFQTWIGIAPFAAHKWKIYPLDQMEEVIRLLCEKRPNCRIFFFGGGDKEMEQFDKWCGKYPQCTNASGALRYIEEELALMSNLDVMLSMDSGNMHMAAITGCRVVSVWGATHPYAGFAPWNQSADDIIQADLPCRPCSVYGNKKCSRGDFACMRQITPQMIVDRLLS